MDSEASAIYTPPDYESDKGARPLVILFSGPMYIGSGVGPSRPGQPGCGRTDTATCCLRHPVRSAPSAVDESASLKQSRQSWFRNCGRPTVSVQMRRTSSLAGLARTAVWAAYIALQHPNVFGNVLSQSGRVQIPAAGSSWSRTHCRRCLQTYRGRRCGSTSIPASTNHPLPKDPRMRARWMRAIPQETAISAMCCAPKVTTSSIRRQEVVMTSYIGAPLSQKG